MYWSQVRILAGPPIKPKLLGDRQKIQPGCDSLRHTARTRLEMVFSFIFFSSIDLTPRLNSNVLHGPRKFVQIIIWKMIKIKQLKRMMKTVTSTQEGTKETSAVTNRPNIDVITARNEEEVTQNRKTSYKKAGIVALLVVVIIIAIYFLS